MRILITGSSGLVGAELAASLRARGHEVVEYDIARPPADGAVEDIRDPVVLADRMQGCDGVFHLAAVSRVAWGERDPDRCHSVNVEGTRRVIEAALAAPARPWLIFASSREVYGDPDILPVTEDAPMIAANHYGRSKAEGEALINAARGQGLRTAIIRLSNVYGTANDHPDRAVPALLVAAIQGQQLRITGAEVFFDFVHVADCVTGMLSAMERLEGGIADLPPIQLTTGIPTSLRELAQKASAVAGREADIVTLPPRSFDVRGFCGIPARAGALLDWQAGISLDEGLARLHRILSAQETAAE